VLRSARADPRVRLLRNGRALGVGATRNRLLRHARGRYVTPCDADDLMLPGNLRVLSAYLDSHPAVGYAYGSFLMLESHPSGRLARAPWIRGKQHRGSWDLLEFTANHGGAMMRRRLVERVGGYDESTPLDSVSLTLKLAEITQLRLVPGVALYAYRRRLRRRPPDWSAAFRDQVRKAMARRG
jgi:glycosyltransferase involved in cell wall biosynthesis